MDTKSKTTLWLLGQSPPLTDCVAEHNFVGAYPPSRGKIILQHFGYDKYHQANTKLQSSTSESIKLVVQDVQNWWAKTGIPTQSCKSGRAFWVGLGFGPGSGLTF